VSVSFLINEFKVEVSLNKIKSVWIDKLRCNINLFYILKKLLKVLTNDQHTLQCITINHGTLS